MSPSVRSHPVAAVALALVVTAMVLGSPAAGQVGINALIQDTQQMSEDPDRMCLVWWIPLEYWQVVLGNDPSVGPEDLQQILDTLGPYLLVGAVDGTIGPFGGIDFVSGESLRASVSVIDSEGVSYRPLPEEAIGVDARNLLAMIQPMLASNMGALGENLVFLFFQANTEGGRPVADATAAGSFTVMVNEYEFPFRLPLGSVVPAKICPQDGERLSGAWSFCPFHGDELVPAPAGGG